MKQSILMEKYHIYEIDIKKTESKLGSIDAIINYLEDKIKSHKVSAYIGKFDHYSHTKSLEDGEINPDILDAKEIIFCFGKKLPKAAIMAIRPRSIGVAEFKDYFAITFMEAPNEEANSSMESWVKSIIK